MKRLLFFICLGSILGLSGCTRQIGYTVVKGTVVEYYSGEPIEGVGVFIWYDAGKNTVGTKIKTKYTDDKGKFRFSFRALKNSEYSLNYSTGNYFYHKACDHYRDDDHTGPYAPEIITSGKRNIYEFKMYKKATLMVQYEWQGSNQLINNDFPYYDCRSSESEDGDWMYTAYPVSVEGDKEHEITWTVLEGTDTVNYTDKVYFPQGEQVNYKITY